MVTLRDVFAFVLFAAFGWAVCWATRHYSGKPVYETDRAMLIDQVIYLCAVVGLLVVLVLLGAAAMKS